MVHPRKIRLAALVLSALALASPAYTAEVDKLVPDDAQMLFVVNVRQAINSPLAKKKGIVDLIKNGVDTNPQAKQILQTLGIDLTKDIESVAVSVAGINFAAPGAKPDKVLAVVRGNFDPDKLDAAAKKTDMVKVTKEGTTTVYEITDKSETGYATIVGKNIIAASPSKEYLLKAVKNIGGGSKDLVKASAKIKADQSLWMVMPITEDLRKMMAGAPGGKEIGAKLESFSFAVKVSDAIVADANFNTADAATAKALEGQINLVLPFLQMQAEADEKHGPLAKELFAGLKITAGQDALNINLKVSEETLDKIIKLAMNK
jgi:hypothetical protein